MIIFLWTVCVGLFLFVSALLITFLMNHPRNQETLTTLIDGIKEGLRNAGFGFTKKPKYEIELWKWETLDDDEVCEDCLDRASWPPMDIADWMKAGLPGTPESHTECGEDCQCQLIRHNPKKSSKRRNRKSN